MQRTTLANAMVWSANLTTGALTILVIVAELVPGLKDWLGATFSHHWLGKGILEILFFAVVTFLLSAVRPRDEAASLRRGLTLLAWLAALCTLLLIGFFWYEAAR